MLMLEALEHAVARGARADRRDGRVWRVCDAYHVTAPSEDGNGAAACDDEGAWRRGRGSGGEPT